MMMNDKDVDWRWLLPLLVLVALVYSGSLSNGFVWDDRLQIVQNPHLERVAEWPGYFTGFSESLNFRSPQLTYRPFLPLSLLIDRQWWGLEPFGYHLTNLILHLANVVLVVLLGTMLAGSRSVGIAAGILFGLHPAQTEAVDWVSGRTDLIAAFFSLSAVIGYLCWSRSAGWRGWMWGAGTLVMTACALFSKETAVAVPLAILLVEGLEYRRFGRRLGQRLGWSAIVRAGLVMLVVAAYLLIRFSAMEAMDQSATRLGWGRFMVTVGAATGEYFRLIIWPSGLTVMHDLRSIAPSSGRLAVVVAAGLAMVGSVWAVWRARPDAGFGLLWAMAFLLPSFALIALDHAYLIADRNLYLPMAGIGIAVGRAARDGMDVLRSSYGRPGRAVGAMALVALVVGMGWATVSRHAVWRNDVTLWEDAVTRAPGSSWAHLNLGMEYSQANRLKAAVGEFQRAIALDPHYGKAHLNLGKVYEKMGRPEEAVASYRRAIEEAPASPDPYGALANLYMARQSWGDAIGLLERLVMIDPTAIDARLSLAVSYQEVGEFGKAIALYQQVLSMPTAPPATYYNLGLALERAGRDRDAIEAYRQFLSLAPAGLSSYRQRAEQRLLALQTK